MRIARTGDLAYRNTDGSERIEVVTPEVLFSKDSIDSFKMKPITLEHPPEMVNSSNSTRYSRGLTGHHAVIDSTFLGLVGTVTDKETVDSILKGEADQTSCGYLAGIRPHNDGKYYQTNRSGNHIAATRAGRAGVDIGFHIDSADEFWWATREDAWREDINNDLINEVLQISPRQYFISTSKPMTKLDDTAPEVRSDECESCGDDCPCKSCKAKKKKKMMMTQTDSLESEFEAAILALINRADGVDGGFHDALNELLRMDVGGGCGKGWTGTKGNCKRVPKGTAKKVKTESKALSTIGKSSLGAKNKARLEELRAKKTTLERRAAKKKQIKEGLPSEYKMISAKAAEGKGSKSMTLAVKPGQSLYDVQDVSRMAAKVFRDIDAKHAKRAKEAKAAAKKTSTKSRKKAA